MFIVRIDSRSCDEAALCIGLDGERAAALQPDIRPFSDIEARRDQS